MTALATSEERRIELLAALAASDGSKRLAVKRLAAQGTTSTEAELETLRTGHAGAYQALAVERARGQEEAIAQEYRELTRVTQRVTRSFMDEIADQIDEGGIDSLPPDLRRGLPQVVQAAAKVMQVSTDKLLSLTGRDQGGAAADPLAAVKTLMDMGVLTAQPRADVDSTAEDDDG